MQNTINSLVDWSTRWGMEFNADKCKIMHLGPNNPQHTYTMGNQTLSSTDEERDIGVIINKNLKPSKQCSTAANRARAVLNQITRSFHYRDRHVFKRLYTTYVRPHMEFSVSAWAPTLTQDIDILENVQKTAVNMINGLESATYEDKLRELGLQSLRTRRTRYDLIQTYKILNNLDDIQSDQWFQKASEIASRSTRQSADPLKLITPRTRTQIRKNFFTVRAIESWNELPLEIRKSRNISLFKKRLDIHYTV